MFFFKQKTAYEMRISDWSSDVCSSDLLLDEAGYIRAAAAQDADTPYGYMMQDASLTWAGYEFLETIRDTEIWRLTKTGADRKSVVSGKRVSVRLDLGGGRIIKNNNSQAHRGNYNVQ